MSEQSHRSHVHADKETARNRRRRETGMPLANYSSSPSCEGLGGWGGARNRADRITNSLSDKQVVALLDAAEFAISEGRTFQRHWTIHYGKAGIKAAYGARFVSHVLALVAKQARREGGTLTALWVRERASDKGEHVHILMHLPADMRLHGRTRRWIEAAGGQWRPGVSCVRIVGGRLSKFAVDRSAHHLANIQNVTRYLLKAGGAKTCARLDLSRSGNGGTIVGKRCGWTNNIGAAAREERLKSSGPI